MKKKYEYTYGFHEAGATFEVDTEKFTEEMAKQNLQFFIWHYDPEADPTDEIMKKYAIQAIQQATFNNHNVRGVISDFENLEGFVSLDGSQGITLLSVDAYEFNEDDLNLES